MGKFSGTALEIDLRMAKPNSVPKRFAPKPKAVFKPGTN